MHHITGVLTLDWRRPHLPASVTICMWLPVQYTCRLSTREKIKTQNTYNPWNWKKKISLNMILVPFSHHEKRFLSLFENNTHIQNTPVYPKFVLWTVVFRISNWYMDNTLENQSLNVNTTGQNYTQRLSQLSMYAYNTSNHNCYRWDLHNFIQMHALAIRTREKIYHFSICT